MHNKSQKSAKNAKSILLAQLDPELQRKIIHACVISVLHVLYFTLCSNLFILYLQLQLSKNYEIYAVAYSSLVQFTKKFSCAEAMCMSLNLFLFSLYSQGQNKCFMLPINVEKSLLHTLSMSCLAGKFLCLDQACKLCFCNCLFPSCSFPFIVAKKCFCAYVTSATWVGSVATYFTLLGSVCGQL